MFHRIHALLLVTSVLASAGCAAQSAQDEGDDPSTLSTDDALSAYAKQLVGAYQGEAAYPRFSLEKDGTYRWDTGIRCVKAPCPSGDAGRFHVYRSVYTGARYVNLRSSDAKVSRWFRVQSLKPVTLVGAFGTSGTFKKIVEGGCTTNEQCGNGEQCEAGACVARPLCVQVESTDGRMYAKNFPAGSWSEANAWGTATAKGGAWGVSLATCSAVASGMGCFTEEYMPTCAFVSGADAAVTYTNNCHLKKGVVGAAGEHGESVAILQKGECTKGEPRCATYWRKSDASSVEGAYYVHTFGSDFEAKSWIELAGGSSEGAVLAGACHEWQICTKEYAPVCGGVRSEAPRTFGNKCMFMAAVRADSATSTWSKGYLKNAGECAK